MGADVQASETLKGAPVRESDSAERKATASPLEGCDVVFVLPHLGPGGAQKVATLVANMWAIAGFKIGLITTLDDKEDSHHLDPAVVRVRIRDWDSQRWGASRSFLQRSVAALRASVDLAPRA